MTDTIESLSKRVRELEAFVAILRAAIGGGSPNGVGAIATAADLDGKYGRPKVRCDPTDWKDQNRPTRKGWLLDRCEPEFLDMYAETLEHFASKNDTAGAKASNGKPKSFYDRADAARARGWAKRLREGWQAAQASTGQNYAGHSANSGSRWGTSGWGANAKHTGTPDQSNEPFEEPEQDNGDDSIQF